jgi:hypothetical protein
MQAGPEGGGVRGIGNLLGQGVVAVLQVEQAEVHPGLVVLDERAKEKSGEKWDSRETQW